jgi:hypothetical protein
MGYLETLRCRHAFLFQRYDLYWDGQKVLDRRATGSPQTTEERLTVPWEYCHCHTQGTVDSDRGGKPQTGGIWLFLEQYLSGETCNRQ